MARLDSSREGGCGGRGAGAVEKRARSAGAGRRKGCSSSARAQGRRAAVKRSIVRGVAQEGGEGARVSDLGKGCRAHGATRRRGLECDARPLSAAPPRTPHSRPRRHRGSTPPRPRGHRGHGARGRGGGGAERLRCPPSTAACRLCPAVARTCDTRPVTTFLAVDWWPATRGSGARGAGRGHGGAGGGGKVDQDRRRTARTKTPRAPAGAARGGSARGGGPGGRACSARARCARARRGARAGDARVRAPRAHATSRARRRPPGGRGPSRATSPGNSRTPRPTARAMGSILRLPAIAQGVSPSCWLLTDMT